LKSSPIKRLRQLPFWQPLFVRDFRFFYFGQSISFLGDQFYLIALPWLVIKLTNSPRALGAILVVSGATRAVFQLLAGALSDHLSPRRVLLLSLSIGATVTGLTSLIVALGLTNLWYLYVLAAVFGLNEALFYPAYMSATPLLLTKERLIAGNALLRGTIRFMGMVGPPLAGFIISHFGYAPAFAFDSVSFAFAASMVIFMRFTPPNAAATDGAAATGSAPLTAPEAPAKFGLFASIAEGFRYCRQNRALQILFLYMAFFEFALGGVVRVGLPTLANRLYGSDRGPQFFSWMAAALAAGILCGILITGFLHAAHWRYRLLTGLTLGMGLATMLLGFTTQLAVICALLVVLGTGSGAASILMQAWIQMSTERRLLGRVMSLLMFGSLLLENLAYGLAGIIADIRLPMVFISGGIILLLGFLVTLVSGTLRKVD